MDFLIDFVKQLTSLTNGELLNILFLFFGTTAWIIAFHSDWFYVQLSGFIILLISCCLGVNYHCSTLFILLQMILAVLWSLVLSSLLNDIDKQNGRYNVSSKDLHHYCNSNSNNSNSNSNNSNNSNFDNSN